MFPFSHLFRISFDIVNSFQSCFLRPVPLRRSTRWILAIVTLAVLFPLSVTMNAQKVSDSARPAAALKFAPIPAHAFGDSPFEIHASSASLGTVTYKVLSGPATLVWGNTLTLNGGGVVQLSARQAATDQYAAGMAQTSFTVSTATSQTMNFTKIGDAVKSAISSDTPNFPFINSDGKFFLQNADSDYDTVPANHVWDFYTGKNVQATKLALSKSNSQFDTQAMCEQGNPVYTALYGIKGVVPGIKGYRDGNFCDVVGVWQDPDTGDWYGIVHNELYPNIPRIDVISYAISRDHGKTWTLQAPIVTSPYGVGNKSEFYYYYGEGDPRLVVDTSNGYFYLFYNSRIMTPSGSGFSAHEWEHVSRAPISKKMAPDSWEKYDNGSWTRALGVEWTCDAARKPCGQGEGASALASSIGPDNDPAQHETFVQPASKQTAGDLTAYTNSLLHTASVSWSVYLGKYVAFAEDRNVSPKTGDYDDPVDTMKFYVSDDLAKQKWTYAGSVPYKNSSWYRWMIDAGSLTSTGTIGSTFFAYCSVSCSDPKNDSEYIKVSVAFKEDVALPTYYSAADGGKSASDTYLISHPGESVPASDGKSGWTLVPVPQDTGFFNISHGSKYLGVANGDAGRAWGAPVKFSKPIASRSSGPELSRQQWYFERIKAIGGIPTSQVQYRLINRYSGLALNFSGKTLTTANLNRAITAPIRDWDAASNDASPTPFKVWKAADQRLILTAQSPIAH